MDVGCNIFFFLGVVMGFFCIGEEFFYGEVGDVWFFVFKLGEGGVEYFVCGKIEVNYVRMRRCWIIGGVSILWDIWWWLVDNFFVVVFVRRGVCLLNF